MQGSLQFKKELDTSGNHNAYITLYLKSNKLLTTNHKNSKNQGNFNINRIFIIKVIVFFFFLFSPPPPPLSPPPLPLLPPSSVSVPLLVLFLLLSSLSLPNHFALNLCLCAKPISNSIFSTVSFCSPVCGSTHCILTHLSICISF